MKLSKYHTWKHRITTLALTSAVATIPLAGSLPAAQADSYDRQQTQNGYHTNRPSGYRGQSGRNGVGRNSYTGTVSRLFSGSQFELALNNGGSLRVAANNGQSRQLRIGDTVTVNGSLNGNHGLYVADSMSAGGGRGYGRGSGRKYGGNPTYGGRDGQGNNGYGYNNGLRDQGSQSEYNRDNRDRQYPPVPNADDNRRNRDDNRGDNQDRHYGPQRDNGD